MPHKLHHVNNVINQRVLIIWLCLTFEYENSKCMPLLPRACTGVGMRKSKSLNLHKGDPGFLEKGFIYEKDVGVCFTDFISFFLNIP